MSLEVVLVNTDDTFKELKEDWGVLFNECLGCNIFLSWEWMHTWWEVFNDQFTRKLYILCVYDESRLIGIAPFQIIKTYPMFLITGRKIQFLGTGEAFEDRIMSEYGDFILLPGREKEVCQCIESYLHKNKKDWDFADFELLLHDAWVLQCFTEKPSLVKRQRFLEGARYFIPDVDNLETYQKTLGKRWAKMYTKKNNKINRDGEVKVTQTDTSNAIEEDLQLLAKMHGSRWLKRTEKNIFDSKRFYQFHSNILKQLVPEGRAFIKTLSLNGEPLASFYVFVDKAQIHYYQSGFFKESANRYSPLFLLLCKEVGLAGEQGKAFDFMYDDDNSYKKTQYAANSKEMYRLMWTPQNYRFVLFNNLKRFKKAYEKFLKSFKLLLQNKK